MNYVIESFNIGFHPVYTEKKTTRKNMEGKFV